MLLLFVVAIPNAIVIMELLIMLQYWLYTCADSLGHACTRPFTILRDYLNSEWQDKKAARAATAAADKNNSNAISMANDNNTSNSSNINGTSISVDSSSTEDVVMDNDANKSNDSVIITNAENNKVEEGDESGVDEEETPVVTNASNSNGSPTAPVSSSVIADIPLDVEAQRAVTWPKTRQQHKQSPQPEKVFLELDTTPPKRQTAQSKGALFTKDTIPGYSAKVCFFSTW